MTAKIFTELKAMQTGLHLEVTTLIPQPTLLHGKLTSEFTRQGFSNRKSLLGFTENLDLK